MHTIGLTIEDVSRQAQVDPKTVERWINDEHRVPHRRTRMRVARLLGVDEAQLWPALADDARKGIHLGDELVCVYPNRSAIPPGVWAGLLQRLTAEADILMFSGRFLVEQHSLLSTIRAKARSGIRFRIAVGDERSAVVIQRDREEGSSGGLEGRVQMTRQYLQEVALLPGVEIRTHTTTLYNSLYRFDDQILVNCHTYGSVAGQSPTLHLRRSPEGTMWQHYVRTFDRVWRVATPERLR